MRKLIDWHSPPADHPVGEKPDSVSISIECANSAFDIYWNTEAGRILRELSDTLIVGDTIPQKLFDANGNSVGSVAIAGDCDDDADTVRNHMQVHIEAIEKILHSKLKQNGDKACDCQRLTLQLALSSLEACVNGIEESDLQQ